MSEEAIPRDPAAVEAEQRLRVPYGVSFKLKDANVPSSLYVQPDDQITVVLANQGGAVGVANARLFLRILRLDGKIQIQTEDISLLLGINVGVTFKPAVEGFMLTVSLFIVSSTSFPLPGTVYGAVYYSRGSGAANFIGYMLTCGFIGRYSPLAWPHGAMNYISDGIGFMRQLTGAVPAAGAEISETVPAGMMWRVVGFNARFTASVAVFTRVPNLVYQDSVGNTLTSSSTGNGITATNARDVSWSVGAVVTGLAGSAKLNAPIPETGWLYGGSKIVTVTESIQAADAWTAISYYVEQKMTGI